MFATSTPKIKSLAELNLELKNICEKILRQRLLNSNPPYLGECILEFYEKERKKIEAQIERHPEVIGGKQEDRVGFRR